MSYAIDFYIAFGLCHPVRVSFNATNLYEHIYIYLYRYLYLYVLGEESKKLLATMKNSMSCESPLLLLALLDSPEINVIVCLGFANSKCVL